MSDRVPEGWDSKKLGDVASLIMGQSPTSDTYNADKEGVPFFQGKADFGVKYPKIRYWCTSPTKIAPMGSILFSVRAPVGDVNLNNVEACIGRGLASISGTSIDNTFLYQSLVYAKVKFEALGQGSTFEAINGNELKEFPLVLPPLPEQNKIASILTSVDDVIEITQRQIDKLQDLKKATMNELLTKGIGHTEFKDSELGRIPKSWEVKSLGDYVKLQGGNAFPSSSFSDSGIPVVRISNIMDGIVDMSKCIYFSESERFRNFVVCKGDILLAMSGATTGKVGVYGNKFPSYLNQRVGRFRVLKKSKVVPYFLHHLVQSSIFSESTLRDAIGGAQPNISSSQVESVNYAFPPINEQEVIASTLGSIDQLIEIKRKKLSQSQSLKKSLMQDLLTGKVRVQVN